MAKKSRQPGVLMVRGAIALLSATLVALVASPIVGGNAVLALARSQDAQPVPAAVAAAPLQPHAEAAPRGPAGGEPHNLQAQATEVPSETATIPATATPWPTLQLTPTYAPTQVPSPTPTTQPTPTRTALPSPTATRVQPTVGAAATPPPPADSHPTRIEATAIGLDAPVVEMGYRIVNVNGVAATDWQVPTNEAAFHQGAALPGHPGNTVVSGHSNVGREVFRYLDGLKIGDVVTLYVGSTAYRYAVSQRETVLETGATLEQRIENAKWILPTSDERLTLITCWPYPASTHRLIIVARPVL